MKSHPVDVYVGKQLRLRRSMLGLSQDALGKAIGITFQQIQKYERGINRISASMLFEISKIVNVPISYFFEGFESGSQQEQGFADEREEYKHGMSSKETSNLIRAYSEIEDPKVRKKVVSLIKSIAFSGDTD